MHIVTTIDGYEAAEKIENTYLRQMADDPILCEQARSDGEHDLRAAILDGRYHWWLVIVGNTPVAWCAAWPADEQPLAIICGENYERRGLGRELGLYPAAFIARQQWLIAHRLSTVTWIFDQPVALHEAAGWQRTGDESVSEHGHHWQQLTWTPTT